MGPKDPERQSASQRVNYWGKLPKEGAKGVSAVRCISPLEGDNKKLEQKKRWCVQADQSLKTHWRSKNEQEQE